MLVPYVQKFFFFNSHISLNTIHDHDTHTKKKKKKNYIKNAQKYFFRLCVVKSLSVLLMSAKIKKKYFYIFNGMSNVFDFMIKMLVYSTVVVYIKCLHSLLMET